MNTYQELTFLEEEESFLGKTKLVIELALEVAAKMRPPATKIKIKALLSLFFWPAFASATTKINLQKF